MALTQTEPVGLGEAGPETVAPAGYLADMDQLPPELNDTGDRPGVGWILNRYAELVVDYPGDARPYEIQDVQSTLRCRGEWVVSHLVQQRLVPSEEDYQLRRVQGQVVLERVVNDVAVRYNWDRNFSPHDTGVRAASISDYHRLLLEIFDPA